MSSFKKKIINGQTYDMAHLNSHTMQVTHGTATYNVGVEYSCHCFTREFKPGDSLELIYKHGSETRAFDVNRFNLSAQLTGYIQDLHNHDIYHDDRDTFLVIRLNGGDYAVFMRIHKATKNKQHDVILRVKTAHLRNNFFISKPAYRFTRVVHLTANGHALPKQNKSKIIRI